MRTLLVLSIATLMMISLPLYPCAVAPIEVEIFQLNDDCALMPNGGRDVERATLVCDGFELTFTREETL